MCLALLVQAHSEPCEQQGQDRRLLIQEYREKVTQCLVLGKYTRPGPYCVETLVLYFTVEHFLCTDTEVGTWILLGMIVRVAMRTGYHRDPSHSPSIPPLHAEMQRRVWNTIFQLDLMISAQVSLPRALKEGQYDTSEPRNLLDEDFDENTTHLPPSRDEKFLTPMLDVNNFDQIGNDIMWY